MVTEEELRQNYFENKLQFSEFLLNPTSEKLYPHITKELSTGRLSQTSFFQVNYKGELFNTLVLFSHLFKNTIRAYDSDIKYLMATSRSIDGFESILQRANINDQNVNTTIKESSDKKGWIFGLGRQNNNQVERQ